MKYHRPTLQRYKYWPAHEGYNYVAVFIHFVTRVTVMAYTYIMENHYVSYALVIVSVILLLKVQ